MLVRFWVLNSVFQDLEILTNAGNVAATEVSKP